MIKWTKSPSERQYRAASSYLRLRLPDAEARALVRRLRAAPVQLIPAKDVLRASGLDAVPPDDPRVAKKLKKIGAGRKLAPILLVRGQLRENLPLVVADGFHRLSAAKASSSRAAVACQLVDLPAGSMAETSHPDALRRVRIPGEHRPAGRVHP